jgi:hypothetical protein
MCLEQNLRYASLDSVCQSKSGSLKTLKIKGCLYVNQDPGLSMENRVHAHIYNKMSGPQISVTLRSVASHNLLYEHASIAEA